jgi:hypothetical protein
LAAIGNGHRFAFGFRNGAEPGGVGFNRQGFESGIAGRTGGGFGADFVAEGRVFGLHGVSFHLVE